MMDTARRRFISAAKKREKEGAVFAGDCFIKCFPHRSEGKEATKSARRRRPSTQYPPKPMHAKRFELSTEALDFYKRVTVSEKKIVIVSTGELHFYGTDTLFIRRSR